MSKQLFSRKGIVYLDRTDYGDWFIMGAGALADEDARALADAIYNELGLGWIPYPENRPQIFDGHYECFEVTIKDWRVTEDKYFVWRAWYKNGIFDNGQFGGPMDEHVVAYRPLSAPYQPKSEE
jgi:hypothetical protein